MNELSMTTLLVAALLAVFGLILWRFFAPASDAIDAGAVSQSWLIEHRAGKQSDRFSA